MEAIRSEFVGTDVLRDRSYSPYGMIFWVRLVMAIAQILPYTLTGYSVRMLRDRLKENDQAIIGKGFTK